MSSILLLSPVLWTPFLLTSLLIGGVVSGLLWLLSARLSTRLAGTSLLRHIVDDLAGRRLVAARDFLTQLDGFERGA